jgi:transcriptional regulator with XRE-family HTH domain
MTPRELAHRVQELRRQRGLTVGLLAERAQITQGYVVLIEAGQQRLPPRQILVRLARALGVSEQELLDPTS